ncbi:MAG: hypothetical protein MMC23_006440 [Stictis urceolatum]|nr:hypothetical protein [Stictis urceolata]
MREAVRLMSNPQGHRRVPEPSQGLEETYPQEVSDPFSSSQLTYSTNGEDIFPAPASYPARKYSWIHIFPEGRVHQHPHKTMRYFKWGVARLILEPDECPDIVPIWIEGNEQIMHESREFPRFVPRLGKRLGIWFGENVAGEGNSIFRDLRLRWQMLVEQDKLRQKKAACESDRFELSDELKYGREAVELRKECTMEVRKQVLRLRRQRGLPDEDPKEGLPETWVEEGTKREGKMKDGSWVKDT